MKPYFAKYLPVEGEIKIRDWYFNKYGELCLYQASFPTYEYIGGKLAKPFLCSRDIQVGDRVVNFDVPYETLNGSLKIDTEEEYRICKSNGDCKVIGEISPEAIWVKEGDEFENDEVSRNTAIADPFGEVSWYNKPLFPEPILNVRNEHGYRYVSTRIEIKCPTCKKFH